MQGEMRAKGKGMRNKRKERGDKRKKKR